MSVAGEFLEDFAVVQALLEAWCVKKGANSYTIGRVRQLWTEEYLLSLGVPGKKRLYWPSKLANKNYRFLFRHHLCVTLLGIQERLVEGTPGGIPAAVDEWLRTKAWPDAKGKGRHGGQSSSNIAHEGTNQSRTDIPNAGILQRVVHNGGVIPAEQEWQRHNVGEERKFGEVDNISFCDGRDKSESIGVNSRGWHRSRNSSPQSGPTDPLGSTDSCSKGKRKTRATGLSKEESSAPKRGNPL